MNIVIDAFGGDNAPLEVTNRKLNQLHIRERIQGAIYDAMKKK